MNKDRLIKPSRQYYKRYYRLIALAMIIMMAVITGSLFLGDSVRGTLTERVQERLGSTETVVSSGVGFMQTSMLHHPLFAHARGYLFLEGYISVDDQLLPVQVWGSDVDSLAEGHALINEPLAAKLGLAASSATDWEGVLHLPSRSLVPSGSLFVSKSYATQMRVHVDGVKDVKSGGNLFLRNEQTLPLNIFVSRQHLAELMSLQDKYNIILSDDQLSEQQVAEAWSPAISGIHLDDSVATYDGVFMPQPVVDALHPRVTYLSYLVNDIVLRQDSIPYSFVTAVTEWKGQPLTRTDVILSDYAAARLHAQVGDTIQMEYFVSSEIKDVRTNDGTFRVKAIVPLADLVADTLLRADFPGLSKVNNCTDWDSDLPIRMDRIHPVDEDYWHEYRNTPKALVAYEAVATDWSSEYGVATALRSFSAPSTLTASQFLKVVSPRQQGLYSATHGTDFAGLFLSLGFFIILSAILLMQNPLHEMMEQRRSELQLYLQLGFTPRSVRCMLFREVASVLLLASPIGVLAGIFYSVLILWLLGNVWSGATHTEGFMLHLQPLTLLLGWLAGLVVSILSLLHIIMGALKPKKEQYVAFNNRSRHWLHVGYLVLFITFVLVGFNFITWHSVFLFVVCGLLWILSVAIFLHAIIGAQAYAAIHQNTHNQALWQTIYAYRRSHTLAFLSLALGVFTVFAVGLNRPDFHNAEYDQATGGYDLYIESRVPIQYNLNLQPVRQKLSLDEIPYDTRFLHFLRHTEDDASCLNLNRVATPTVLGIRPSFLTTLDIQPVFDSLKCVYIDEEALLWGLGKQVGDTLIYRDGQGREVPVLIAGTYPTGVFHGNAIMTTNDFRALWPQEGGVEVLLARSSSPEKVARVLSRAMSEYGISIQTTEERMQHIFEVTDTYLIIFLTLGALGVLLGIFSLIIIVRKNLTARRPMIEVLLSIGFSEKQIRQMLFRENIIIPLLAVFIGAIGSVISISANVGGAGWSTWLLALLFMALLCLVLVFGIKKIINQYSLKQIER